MTKPPASLKERLILNVPREDSGPKTAKRFDFQKNWALCKLLECHKAGEPYLIVFDYHDDILLLDSESSPKKIRFYQVKTKDNGHWTLTEILKQKKGKDGTRLWSPFAKLYHNKIRFEGETESLNFVSNARFSLRLKDESPSLTKTSISVTEISEEDRAKLRKQLKSEHSLLKDPSFEAITFFIATDLSLSDHEAHTKGKLNEFLDSLYKERKFQLSTIYRTLFDEVRRKNNHDIKPKTFQELIEKKSIGKSTFDSMLGDLGLASDFDEAWSLFQGRLHSEHYPLTSMVKIKQEWTRCEIERMDATNFVIQELRKLVKKVVSELKTAPNLTELLDSGLTSCLNKRAFTQSLRSPEYVKAMILFEFYEHQKLSETRSKPPKKKK